ncbi:MAG: tetratricopeptide repeat protein [Elusimicrobia bacterium]|nr:tetratricopeptide repeat protein [Elusimicrobiota bacterium]
MKKYLPGLLFISLSFIIYSGSLDNRFVYDDKELIIENPLIKSLSGIPEILNPSSRLEKKRPYRPVRDLSYALDYFAWGENPSGFHITGILLHGMNGFLVFCLLGLLFRNNMLSLIAALLFTAHPVNSEAVAWISGRKEILYTFFLLLSFIALLEFAKTGRRLLYALSLISFFLSVLAKESGLVLVPLLMLYNALCGGESPRGGKMKERYYVPHLFIAAVLTVFFIKTRGGGIIENAYRGGFLNTMMTMPSVVIYYIRILVFPDVLKAEYAPRIISSLNAGFLLSLIIPAAAAALAIRNLKKHKEASFGVLWFFLGLIPVSNILPLTNMMAERYLYLSSIGFCLFISFILSHLITRKKVMGIALASAVILLYSIRTFLRNDDWKDDFTLWSKAVEQTPSSARARYNLAVELMRLGRLDEAELNLGKFAEADPGDPYLYVNLGMISLWKKDTGAAEKYFLKAIALDPGNEEGYNNLGNIYFAEDRAEDAERMYKKALELDYYLPETHYNLGNLYFDKAEALFDESRIRPLAGLPLETLAKNRYLLELDRLKSLAENHYLAALKLSGHAGACKNLSLVYRKESGIYSLLGYKDIAEKKLGKAANVTGHR